jgi:hypothetical protein
MAVFVGGTEQNSIKPHENSGISVGNSITNHIFLRSYPVSSACSFVETVHVSGFIDGINRFIYLINRFIDSINWFIDGINRFTE